MFRLRADWLLLYAALGSSAAAAAGVPSPLSADHSQVNVNSTYGSGHLGSWQVDRFDLPAFRYTVDEQSDPRAQQPELAGATDAQHQVGNDHIVAAAFNHGYTQLWSQDRLEQWANLYQEGSGHYAGGYGYLNVGGTVFSMLWPDRPPGADFERDFGVGYASKALTAAGIHVEQVVYAPFGDDPLLLDDVAITNQSSTPQSVSWFEYWDVNPYDQSDRVNRGVGQPVWDAATTTLSASQSGGRAADTTPLSLFAAALLGPVDGYETSVATFFGSGTRAVPAEVAADQLSGTLASPSAAGQPGGALFVFRAPLTLAPGQTVTLRYVYGMAHAEQIAGLVAKYRAASEPLSASESDVSARTA